GDGGGKGDRGKDKKLNFIVSSGANQSRISIFAGVRCQDFQALVDTAAEDAVCICHAPALEEICKVVDVPTNVAGVNGIIRFTVIQDSEAFQTPPLLPVSYLEAVWLRDKNNRVERVAVLPGWRRHLPTPAECRLGEEVDPLPDRYINVVYRDGHVMLIGLFLKIGMVRCTFRNGAHNPISHSMRVRRTKIPLRVVIRRVHRRLQIMKARILQPQLHRHAQVQHRRFSQGLGIAIMQIMK
ncbi:unnamed protein product, partial [Effrenium voratum]